MNPPAAAPWTLTEMAWLFYILGNPMPISKHMKVLWDSAPIFFCVYVHCVLIWILNQITPPWTWTSDFSLFSPTLCCLVFSHCRDCKTWVSCVFYLYLQHTVLWSSLTKEMQREVSIASRKYVFWWLKREMQFNAMLPSMSVAHPCMSHAITFQLLGFYDIMI